jgi:hypothetical protein
METWSTAFLNSEPESSLVCAVEADVWRRLQDEHDNPRRLFAKLEHGDKTWICALGSPVSCDMPSNGRGGSRQRLFLPYWIQTNLCLTDGEIVHVDWLPEDAFPEATLIKIRPHDSAFYCVDAKEELERHFTGLGVVQEGTTVAFQLEALGGFTVAFDILKTEPANVVLAHGDEVAIDFDEALDAPAPAAPAPVAPIQEAKEEDWSAVLPQAAAAAAPEPQGHILGGAAAPRRMADGRPWNPWREKPKS